MRKKAFSYIRFSLSRQEKGDSLRRQTDLARAWCDERDVELVTDYQDLGVSGFRGKNSTEGALGQFLEHVESGVIPPGSYLLLESLDRMSRQQVHKAMSLLLQIITSGVIVVTLGSSDRREYHQDSPNLMIDLIMSLTILSRAHEESSTKSDRNRAAWDEKRKNASRHPITSKGPGWLRLVDGRWEVIEERAKIVKMIYKMSSAGKTVGEISRFLNDKNIPTFRSGKFWHSTTVSYLLDSRASIGEFAPKTKSKDGSVKKLPSIRDYFPAILTEKEWLKSQRNRGRATHNRGRQSPNVFRGMVRTPDGYPLQYKSSFGGAYAYLRCYVSDAGGGPSRMWRYDEFLEEFIETLNDHLECSTRSAENAARLHRLKAELIEKEGALKNLILALSRGHSEALEGAVRDTEEEIGDLRSEIMNAEATKEDQRAGLDSREPATLSAAIRSLVRSITMDTEERTWEAELLDGSVISRSPKYDS